MSDTPEDLSRILTIPNLLSILRIVGIGVFAWLVLSTGHKFAGAILLASLGATDWVDGYIARHFHQVSNLGKVIDPVADRILFLVGISCILAIGAAPLWLGLVVLAREAIVSVATILVASLGGRRIDVIWAGKAGTFALMFAFPAFLLAHSGSTLLVWMDDFAWVVAIIGICLSWFALASYIPQARKALSEGQSN
jgi:cardiolipin synthase